MGTQRKLAFRKYWFVWAGAALIGAIIAVLVVPGLLDRQATPERLRSKEAAAAQPPEPARTSGRRIRTEGITVEFRPAETDEEPAPEEPERPSADDFFKEPADKVQ